MSEPIETFQERTIDFSENRLLDLTPFRTAKRQFSLPLSKMERERPAVGQSRPKVRGEVKGSFFLKKLVHRSNSFNDFSVKTNLSSLKMSC
jgi:hypothetical protein